MNHTLLMTAGLFSASSLLLVDAAVKGAALLLLAAVIAMILNRDSAATRHLVWLLAVVAILAVPVLSALLPGWRALPEWASIPPAIVVEAPRPTIIARPADGVADEMSYAEPDEVALSSTQPSTMASEPAATPPESPPVSVTPKAIPAPAVWSRSWINVLPLVWVVGFSLLILRLAAARLMLWNSERQGTVIWSLREPAKGADDPLVTALQASCLQLGLSRPVVLLIHSERTIPVVWGVLQSRLLLPAAARHWNGEQLRSVLLHELAHIKRYDTTAQLLTQAACALHWFNPLVWFAAWRLGVERERACDDLVLASGVRPSVYAGHLLDVVTELSPARWSQSCGLAMARKSSLESRLIAVLSGNLNRRGVSVALATIALAMAVSIVVPIAMLRAADEKPGTPVQQQESPKTKGGQKLQPGTEDRLKWGEPANGLRAAIIIRPASGEPKRDDNSKLYLVVQNVSEAPIRFSDTSATPELRVLYIKIDGEIQAGIGSEEPTLTDTVLQPREVASLFMYPPSPKGSDQRSAEGLIVEGVLKDTHQSLVAHLQIEQAPAGAWKGKLVTGETTGAVAAGHPQPKDKKAQSLFKMWRDNARQNGNIPGGLVAGLHAKVKEFIRNNTGDLSGDPYAKKMAPLETRFETARDWTPADVVSLLDDIAAVTTIPLETTLRETEKHTFRSGTPLPRELANLPWGEALPNGLRMAWVLAPSADQHRLGTALKSRIVFHNSGKDTVVFRTRTWHQSNGHKAHDANGDEILMNSTQWTTLAWLIPYRLAPGEFIEVIGAGIGVGANKNDEDWQGTRVGSWIQAKEGDEVTFTPDSVPANDWNETAPPEGQPDWWPAFVAERLKREMPFPAAIDDRTDLLSRVMRDLFRASPSPDEISALTTDASPAALDSLTRRLVNRAGLTPVVGALKSGETRFRVVAADPDAATKPRTANNPGRYTLGENIRLVVSRRPVGERIVNQARIQFFSPDPTKPVPGEPHELKLPDGYDTWAAVWVRGGTVLWVKQKSGIRTYDFTNPAQVKETPLKEPADLETVPMPIRDALRGAINVSDAPASAK